MTMIKPDFEEEVPPIDVEEEELPSQFFVQILHSGINSQGNNYITFLDSNSHRQGYYYANQNGSSYCRYPDGSYYYNDGQGYSYYVDPDGLMTDDDPARIYYF
ncbi:hypothetical protein Hypma_006745 [Hypsizygus marmoreus]|uniref:Uncharacterized protein n=1 Tax=Hypsizygus marmoreus TaxID=39966 RepID=A0A369JVK6_HYPMA|nr:hypothetical protein Hypma_006745 [Hypsizygus marmoreus]